MLLIDNPLIDPTGLPGPGATITGTAKFVTIDDIIASEGPRVPDASSSQKAFKTAFILLTRPGTFDSNVLPGIETIRSAWAGRFTELTHCKGTIMDITPSISITIGSPSDSATLYGSYVDVKSAVINTTGNETGVTVNGMVATVYNGQFFVNHVPLTDGPNTITATATDTSGNTLTAAVTVNAITTSPHVTLMANIESGIAPLTAYFSVTTEIPNAVSSYAFDYEGDGTNDYTGTNFDDISVTYSAEGVYYPTITITDAQSISYSDTMAIVVLNAAELDTLLRGKWEGMKMALAAGNIEGALNYFLVSSQGSFGQQFNALSHVLVQIVSDMNSTSMVNTRNDYVEYDLRTTRNGETYSFQLLFIKDADGIWRIRSF